MSVLEINGDDLEGKTWRELQIYLGERLPIAAYHYLLKFKQSAEIFNGRIRSVNVGKVINTDTGNKSMLDDRNISQEFKALKDQLQKAVNSGGVSFEMLLASTKQGYESQIGFKDQIISQKDELIKELKKDIDDLEDDLQECNKQLSSSTGIAQYLEIGQKLLNARYGSGKNISLKESDPTDIPAEILQVIGAVNWRDPQITPDLVTRIADGIKQYISLLPLKGQ